MTQTGTLEYTERAQSQDSSDALRGDIVRGLVELITNCDDAYVRAHRSGPIRITIEHLDDAVQCARIIVSDVGTGMTSTEMISNLTKLGARSSAFGTGESVRGLHGRGARDLAIFGSVHFASVANGSYSALEIDGIRWNLTNADEPAEEERLRALGLTMGQAGMTVTVQVKRPNVIPADLTERLSLNAELRHILTEREVTLTETGMRDVPTQRLTYDAPAVARELLDTTVDIPGYEGETATFKVVELALPDVGPVTPETQHGILIRGSRAVYQNTLFDMEARPGASYLHGEFVCPLIDNLIRSFDDVEEARGIHTPENPFRLLTRSRDGLTPSHPLTKKLKAVFASNLLPLIQEIEARHSGQREPGEALKRRLDQAARELSRLLADDLAELEEEPTGTGEDIPPVKLIPSRVTLRPHERKTLTIHLRPAKLSDSWDGEIELRNDNPNVVELLGAADVVSEHPDNADLWVSRVRLSALEGEGTAVVTVCAGDDAASATIRVDTLTPPPPEVPETLEFSHERYRVRASRRRTVEIAAPLDLVVAHGPEVAVDYDGDAGVVLLTQHCRMQLDENLGWYKGRVSIHGELAGANGILTATLGTECASAHCSVVDPTDPGGLDLRFEWQDTRQGPLRASLVPEPEGMKLVIFGRHPGIAPILGRWNEDSERFEHDDSQEAGLVLSEIIATEIAHFILERDFARPGRLFDAGTYAAQYRRRLERYLVVAQRLLAAFRVVQQRALHLPMVTTQTTVSTHYPYLEDVAMGLLSEIHNSRRVGSKPLFTTNQCIALARHRGWDGRRPGTLEEAGNTIGVTRERVRQLELKLEGWMVGTETRREEQLPYALAQAVEVARLARSDEELGQQLRASRLATGQWSFKTLADLLRALGRNDLHEKIQNLKALSDVQDIISAIVWKASARTGFAHIEAIRRELVDHGGELAPSARELTDSDLGEVLERAGDVLCLPIGYFFAASTRDPTVVETTRRMLQISQPLALRDIRDGLRRRSKFRQIPLRVPLEVLRAFFMLHPGFEIDHDDRVRASGELPETADTLQRWIVEQVRASDYGLLTRVQVMQRARRDRKSANSVSIYLTYGEQIAHDRRGFYFPVGCPPDESRIADALEVADATTQPSAQEWYFDPDDKVVTALIELGDSVLASGVIFPEAGDRGYLDLLSNTHYPVRDESGESHGTVFKSEPMNALAGLSTFFSHVFPEPGDLLKLEIDLETSVARAEIGGSELETT